MDQVSEAIGELTATVRALAVRGDERHAENVARNTEVIARLADTQSQLHEVKHAHNNHLTMVAALNHKVDTLANEMKRLSQPYDVMLSLRAIVIGVASLGAAILTLVTLGHIAWAWLVLHFGGKGH